MPDKIPANCTELKMSDNSKVLISAKKIYAVHLLRGNKILKSTDNSLRDLLFEYAPSWALNDEKAFSQLLDLVDFSNDLNALYMLQSVLYSMNYFFTPIAPSLAEKIVKILDEHNKP